MPVWRAWPAFVLVAVSYLYAFPYFEKLRSANEMPRILQTQEFVDKGRLWLDERRADMSSQFDTSFGPDGHQYPNKAPGPSFVAIPVYSAAKALGARTLRDFTWAFRVFAVTLPALLFLPFFYRMTGHFTDDLRARRTALVAYALGSPAWVYAILFMSHQLAAVCAGAAFLVAVPLCRQRLRRPKLGAAGVGLFAAAAVMMDYQSAVVAALVGLYVLIVGRERVRNGGYAILGAAPVVVLLGLYHYVCFGSPLRTGYHYSVDEVTRKGFMGIVGLSAPSALSTTFLPSNGLFVLSPWLLLAFVGAFAIFKDAAWRRRAGAEALLCLAVFVSYLLFLSALDPFMARAGWTVGPRYLTVSLPFAAWLSCAGFAFVFKHVAARVAALGAVVASVIIYATAVLTYPHWPDRLQNPLYELSFRLLQSGRSVHSLGHLMGLPGVAAVVPLYACALVALAWAFPRVDGRKGIAMAYVLGVAVVGAYALFPGSGAYAEQAFSFVMGQWEP